MDTYASMKIKNYEVFNLHAELCKVMASPKRLMIIDMLGKRDMNVGEIAETLGMNSATVSQHLRILRDRNLVVARKEGQLVYYSLGAPRMVEACGILREILIETMKRSGALAADFEPEELIVDESPVEGGSP
jgi:ArsR family transcriptional regulator